MDGTGKGKGKGSAAHWRGAAERRAQKRRKAGRIAQELVRDLQALNEHRGCQPTVVGQAILTALKAREGVKRRTAPGTWFDIPHPDQVPSTRLRQTCENETDSNIDEDDSSGEYADANDEMETALEAQPTLKAGPLENQESEDFEEPFSKSLSNRAISCST